MTHGCPTIVEMDQVWFSGVWSRLNRNPALKNPLHFTTEMSRGKRVI